MHVVIIGAGEVGTSIAASLASDHEVVVVIDVDPDRADQLKYELDVLTIAGDGTASEIQTAANVGPRGHGHRLHGQRPDEPRRVRDRENAR